MSENSGLKVFISWSGELAKEVAICLHELLPVIFDAVQPWMSDQDIAAGSRGLDDIARELDGTSFGIIVVTNENQTSQWLNFEAGALSKRVDDEGRVRVVPLLVDLDSGAELTGPMTQFQWKLLNKKGMKELLTSMAGVIGVKADVVERRLAPEWDKFEEAIGKARSQTRHPSVKPRRSVENMMEETLELVRSLANERSVAAQVSQQHADERLRVLERMVLAGLSTWGDAFIVNVMTNGERYEVDIVDPEKALDLSDPAVHESVERSLKMFKVPTRHLVVKVNGKRAIPF